MNHLLPLIIAVTTVYAPTAPRRSPKSFQPQDWDAKSREAERISKAMKRGKR